MCSQWHSVGRNHLGRTCSNVKKFSGAKICHLPEARKTFAGVFVRIKIYIFKNQLHHRLEKKLNFNSILLVRKYLKTALWRSKTTTKKYCSKIWTFSYF